MQHVTGLIFLAKGWTIITSSGNNTLILVYFPHYSLCFYGPPESGWVPVWPPGRRAPVRPGTGSAESAGAEPAAAGWSRWSEACGFSSLCRSDEGPCPRSPWTCRDLRRKRRRFCHWIYLPEVENRERSYSSNFFQVSFKKLKSNTKSNISTEKYRSRNRSCRVRQCSWGPELNAVDTHLKGLKAKIKFMRFYHINTKSYGHKCSNYSFIKSDSVI